MAITNVKFYQPSLVVQNITDHAVTVLDRLSTNSGDVVDLFKEIRPEIISEDLIYKNLFIPNGDLYVEVFKKKTLRILAMDLPSMHYALLEPSNFGSSTPYFPGAIPVVNDQGGFDWVGLDLPLYIDEDRLRMPPASATQDGYLTKEDWAFFYSAAAGGGAGLGIRIWQYQDFGTVASTSVNITAFQNGTGLGFDPAIIVNQTASIVLISNTAQVPTTVISFPGRYLPGNKVIVSSQTGSTVVLNQVPHSSLSCRIYFQVQLPMGQVLPAGYEEDPNFTNTNQAIEEDNQFVNINGDETIYGQKSFQELVADSFRLDRPTADGYVLTSDSSGNADWLPSSGGGAGIPISLTPPTAFNGAQWIDGHDSQLYIYDGYRGKWLSDRTYTFGAGRNSNVVSNLYLRTYDDVPTNLIPFVVPYNSTILSLSTTTSATASWQAQVRKNGGPSPILSHNLSNTINFSDSTQNIDVSTGDTLSLFASGSSIPFPSINILLARRH